MPGHFSLRYGSGSLCPPFTPWGLFSFFLGYSVLPTKQVPFLPSSSYLGLSPHSCMEALFTLLRFQLSVPTVFYINSLYTLLELQHLALGCLPFYIGCPPAWAPPLPWTNQVSTLHARPLLCGNGLAWTPIPCARLPFLVDIFLTLLGLKQPMLGSASMTMPSSFLLVSHTLHWVTLPCWQSHPAEVLTPCARLPV